MYTHIVNYRRRDQADGRQRSRFPIVNIGFWWHYVPRLLIWCWLFGHRAVIDGAGKARTNADGTVDTSHCARWVVCSRCGTRGDPQGSLDPEHWNEGDRYRGPFAPLLPTEDRVHVTGYTSTHKRPIRMPGRIPYRDTGTLGGQLVIGPSMRDRGFTSVGFRLKVGNAGSEHPLGMTLHFGWLGSLYLHTGTIGRQWQRRLNPDGYDSRVIEVMLRRAHFDWKLWAKADEWKRSDPKWMRGSVNFSLFDRLLGVRRYDYQDIPGGTTTRMVSMPERQYLVELKLQRQIHGRRRWRKTLSWSVDWSTLGAGIPYRRPTGSWKGDDICGSAVKVSDASVRAGTWADAAAVAIAARITESRAGNGWSPVRLLPYDPDTGRIVPSNRIQMEVDA